MSDDLTKEHFMRQAIALSEQSVHQHQGGPFGAVIVKDGEIVGQGFNQVTTQLDPTAHAEIVAIRQACQNLHTFDLTGCDIYSSCEPCPMCLAAIYWAKLDRIFYANTRQDAAQIGFDDEWLYQEVTRPPDERKIACQALLADEAINAFQQWQNQPDKVEY